MAMIRKEAFLLIAVSLCLLLVNYAGLLILIGTYPVQPFHPDSKWAPVVVFGIWLFLTQFPFLGMVAALLPHSLHSRFAYPFALALAIYGEIWPFREAFEFKSGIFLNELGLIMLSGFFASWTYFSVYRLIRSRKLVWTGLTPEIRIDQIGFSIRGILTLTCVVALLATTLRFNFVVIDPATALFSAIGFGILATLYAPMNFLLFGDRRQKSLGIFLMILVLLVLPSLLVFFSPNAWGKRDDDWPLLFCLTFGIEAAWLIGLGCLKLLNYRWVSGKFIHQ